MSAAFSLPAVYSLPLVAEAEVWLSHGETLRLCKRTNAWLYIQVRAGAKRSRIAQGNLNDDEDPRLDINGYALKGLAMHRAAQRRIGYIDPEFIAIWKRGDREPATTFTIRGLDGTPAAMIERALRLNIESRCGSCGGTMTWRSDDPERKFICGPICLGFCGAGCRDCFATHYLKGKEPAPCPNGDANAAHSSSTTAEGSARHRAPAPATTAKTGSPNPASASPTLSQQPSPGSSPATDASAPTATEAAKSPARARSDAWLLAIEEAYGRNILGLCASCSAAGVELKPSYWPEEKVSPVRICSDICHSTFMRKICAL